MRVAILGTGLIGGSVGLGLRRARADVDVVAFDPSPAALEGALARGATGAAADTAQEAVAGAHLVVLAMPVEDIADAAAAVAPFVPPAAVVTDVGSAKADVVEKAQAALGERFVGGHPMAGSERHGIEAADAELFREAWWILTPTPITSSTAYRAAAELAAALGARPVAIEPHVHDALVARLSHVPQLAASALVDVAAAAGDERALLELAGGGFRDATRIAASHPELWVGIIRSNRAAVLQALQGLEGRLDEIVAMIEARRWRDLEAFLGRARRARLELFAKPVYTGEPVSLSMLIPDRPGVLAEVTTAAGQLGANIEDLRIIHSTEGGLGRLELVIAGRDKAAALAQALDELGYRVERSELVE